MKVFTVKTAENMKSDILREIACTYALFGTSYADEDTISRLKTNISMPDRQFLRESEKRKYKNNVVFPYEILTSRIKEYINDCYDKIEKTEQYFLSTADYGGNTEKVKSLLKKNVEKLKQKTTQNIIYELDRQLLRNSDIKTVLINVGAEADKQAKSLDNLICYYAKIFAVYYKLNRLAEKGGVYYRIISNGNDCEECHTNVGKSIPINEASAGENFIPFHPNCDCMAEVLDKDGKFIENIGSIKDLYNDENDRVSELFNYKKVKEGLIYNIWNWNEDNIWKIISLGVNVYGWKLSADLLWMAASEKNSTYRSRNNDYASNLAKKNEGLNKFVRDKIWEYGESKNNNCPYIPLQTYEIPLNNGDLGAALHNVKVKIITEKNKNGIWKTSVILTDIFDFTEFKNPFKQGSILKGFLWAANDIAYFDTEWGLLEPVNVEISYNLDFEEIR